VSARACISLEDTGPPPPPIKRRQGVGGNRLDPVGTQTKKNLGGKSPQSRHPKNNQGTLLSGGRIRGPFRGEVSQQFTGVKEEKEEVEILSSMLAGKGLPHKKKNFLRWYAAQNGRNVFLHRAIEKKTVFHPGRGGKKGCQRIGYRKKRECGPWSEGARNPDSR